LPFESEAPKIKAKIISADANGVNLQISSPGKGKWELSIPYNDSNKVALDFISASKK